MEEWTLALIAMIVVMDMLVGVRFKSVLVFNVFQCIGLAGGFIWASSVYRQQDVAGPYATASVLGVWIFSVVMFHMLWGLYAIYSKRKASG